MFSLPQQLIAYASSLPNFQFGNSPASKVSRDRDLSPRPHPVTICGVGKNKAKTNSETYDAAEAAILQRYRLPYSRHCFSMREGGPDERWGLSTGPRAGGYDEKPTTKPVRKAPVSYLNTVCDGSDHSLRPVCVWSDIRVRIMVKEKRCVKERT